MPFLIRLGQLSYCQPPPHCHSRTLQQLTATQTRAISESDAPDPRRIRQIGQLQQDLAEKGQKLIEDMNPPPPIDEQSIDEPVVEPNP